MAVPKRKKSKRRTRQGRAHHAIQVDKPNKCPKCDSTVLPHTVCATCGYYKNKKMLDVETKLDKKLKKKENREEEEK